MGEGGEGGGHQARVTGRSGNRERGRTQDGWIAVSKSGQRGGSISRSAALPPSRCVFTVKTLLIVYHSLTGGARQMAEAARRGAAAEAGVEVRFLRAQEAGGDDVLGADGYLWVTPENLAAMAGMMKDFFDRTYYAALDRIAGRPYATLVCAGSDGENAVRQIARICQGWRLKAVSQPLIVCTHAQTPEAILAPKMIGFKDLERCEEAGGAIAAGMAMGIF